MVPTTPVVLAMSPIKVVATYNLVGLKQEGENREAPGSQSVMVTLGCLRDAVAQREMRNLSGRDK